MIKNRFLKITFVSILSVGILLSCFVIYKIIRWKAYIWLPAYCSDIVKDLFDKSDKLAPEAEKHIMFLICDHFEPGFGPVNKKEQDERIDYWVEHYKKLAFRHKDSDGLHLRYSWFYPIHERNPYVMQRLNKLTSVGLGEIEFHLHHGNDTAESLDRKIKDGLDWFNQFGAMITAEQPPRRYFGFIHGMFTLDNSAYGKIPGDYCGVNNELEILAQNGCYADFTFSCLGTDAQPEKINSIYYATDSPEPKSYNSGRDMKVGEKGQGDLLMIEGPTAVIPTHCLFDIGCLDLPPARIRVDGWVNANVHVKGRPEWIFIKTFIHSAYVSRSVLFSREMDDMFTYLESKYNKPPYRLHYVTAREAYNIAKAAEAGFSGNPNSYRDFQIKPPLNSKNNE